MYRPTRARFFVPFLALLLVGEAAPASAQQSPAPTQPEPAIQSPVRSAPPLQPTPPQEPDVNIQLPVNWLYGAYIPKDAPLVALNGPERFKLYVRQTYTTPGIYIKTGFFATHDQVTDSPPAWQDGFPGFAKRIASNQATNIIQNSFTSVGQGIVGWEPRYDRCRCTGAGPRLRHAFIRNFITYNHSEQSIRPNIMPFAAAFGAGAIGATWNPNNVDITVKGYQSAVTQAWVGVVINMIGEFAPDLKKKFGRHKD
ncbi:MAG: hypothetical protein WAM20_15890 [Acidobacteriaceae bacterium]